MSSATQGPTLHHRQSSGLVRVGRPFDAALFNFFGATFGPVIAWVLLFGVGFYPGSNIMLAIVITFVLSLGMNLTYAFFASIMPRSGGDYVFISRTFHPWLGFAANAGFMFWLTFYIGTAGALFGQFGLGPAFRVLAAWTGDLSLTSVGNWFSTDMGKFISGLAMMALTGPVVIASRRGLRTYFRFQRIVFIVAGVALVVTIGAMAIMGIGGFRSSFNDYAGNFSNNPDAYGTVVTGGGGHGGFDLKQTLLACTWPFYGAAFLMQSAFWAGEGRTGLRAQLTGITLPFFIALIVMLVAAGLGTSVFGTDFLAGLALGDPTAYGFDSAPWFAELAAAWTGPVIGIALTLGLGAWMISYVPFITVMVTRSILAWSLDGIVPEKLGKVDPRTSNPVNATLFTFAFGIFFLALYSFTDKFSVVTALLGFAVTFVITCVAAAVFPFLRKELYEGSSGDVRIGRVPVMSLVGGFGAVGMIAMIVILVSDPSSGTNWDLNRWQVLSTGIVLIVAAGLYFIAAAVRRRQGIDIAAAYRGLPPE
jgi:APA family basic amino acid/polyamine antiporter